MSCWQQQIGENGRPIWSGVDSVYNMAKEDRQGAGPWGIGFLLTIAFVAVPLAMLGDSITRNGGQGGWQIIYLATPIGIGVLLYAYAGSTFINSNWTLRATENDMLEYSGGQWAGGPQQHVSIPLDRVTRVESGPTREWEGARNFGGKARQVPSHEYQTYLFLDNGRRLVVATINGGREETGALAHSIRGWLDGHKGAVAESAPPSGGTEPEGFSI